MSTPGGENPYINPQPQPQGHQPQPSAGNPYAQPPPPTVASPGANPGYGFPRQAPGTPQTPLPQQTPHPPGGYGPMMVPGQPTPPPGGQRRGGVPGWLWAIAGAVVASAAWAGSLVATGVLDSGDSTSGSQQNQAEPDLAGYEYTDDLCEAADTSAFESDYEIYDGSDTPSGTTYEREAVANSVCEISYQPIGDDAYNSVYISYEAVWHKGSNPKNEFADTYMGMGEYGDDAYYDYESEKVAGLGDEAYAVYQWTESTDELTYVTLAVRDGWFELTLMWYGYLDDNNAELSDQDYVTDSMREAAEGTLENLQTGGSGGSEGAS